MTCAELTTLRPGRLVALLTALSAALVLAAPTAAAAWTQNRGDGHNSSRADTDGPQDPGLLWRTDTRELTSDAAPDGYVVGSAIERFSDLNRPVLAPDGTLILRAEATAVEEAAFRLIALDPDDGSLAWEMPDVARSCGQSLDSQGRLWIVRERGNLLEALDPATGAPIDGTSLPLEVECIRTSLHLGGDPETLIIPRPETGGIQAIDISGPEPAEAWVLEPGEAGAPFDAVLGPRDQARRAAVTDTSVLIAGLTGDGEDAVAEVFELSPEDGSEISRTDLPAPVDGAVTDIGSVSFVVEDASLVIGLRVRRGGDGSGYVAGFDLDDELSQRWLQPTPESSGPTHLTLGADGNFHHNAGDGTVRSRSIATGELRWDDVEVVEIGGDRAYSAASDASGVLFTKTSTDRPQGLPGNALAAVSPDGTILWEATRASIANAAGVATDDLQSDWMLGPVRDGMLYAFADTEFLAIDSSGGLALEEACELPFTDVSESSVHAQNICRLVASGITTGVSDEQYAPRGLVTRAQMGTFLARALDLEPVTGVVFPDVDPTSVHAPNINAIAAAEITLGRGDGTFDPGGTVTRDEMASFLARSVGLDGVDGTGFADVPPDSVHAPNIYAVRDAGITEGVTSTRFDPSGEVRRDQMASFLIRMLDVLDAED